MAAWQQLWFSGTDLANLGRCRADQARWGTNQAGAPVDCGSVSLYLNEFPTPANLQSHQELWMLESQSVAAASPSSEGTMKCFGTYLGPREGSDMADIPLSTEIDTLWCRLLTSHALLDGQLVRPTSLRNWPLQPDLEV